MGRRWGRGSREGVRARLGEESGANVSLSLSRPEEPGRNTGGGEFGGVCRGVPSRLGACACGATCAYLNGKCTGQNFLLKLLKDLAVACLREASRRAAPTP